MKDIRRLAAGAALSNTPTGQVQVVFTDFDGGEFDLQPKVDGATLYLVDPNRPSGYAFAITGDIDALDRVQKALATIVRTARNGDDAPALDTAE